MSATLIRIKGNGPNRGSEAIERSQNRSGKEWNECRRLYCGREWSFITNGNLFSAHQVAHRTPGNKRGFIQAKLRNLRSGALIDLKFRSDDELDRVVLEEVEMQYLYSDDSALYFMNLKTFDQIHMSRENVGEKGKYLVADTVIKVEFFEDSPVGIKLPITVDLEVVKTEPAIKGATASNVMKPAQLETGLTVLVPPFISPGEKIRVDTQEGKYVERAR